jgi:nitroreductase
MTRNFDPRPVPADVFLGLVELAARAPSAGKAQGFDLVVLEGAHTGRFWDITLPATSRAAFAWPGLLRAPLVALAVADPAAYVARYAEPDKAATGLGAGPDAWPVPYWTIDASMAVMTLLLAAEDAGLGALFFLVQSEAQVRAAFGLPERVVLLGAVALGYRAEATRPGRSAGRPRRSAGDIVHRGRWRR